MSGAWKQLERVAAKKLGGKRTYRGANFSESLPDILHPHYSLECKYRKTLPRLYYKLFEIVRPKEGKYLLVVHKDRLILSLDAFVDLAPIFMVHTVSSEKPYSTFLESALNQARGYNPDKTPMVVLKQAGMKGELVYFEKAYWRRDVENVL